MSQIASDEERHASLSWQQHNWALAQLTAEQQQTITAAQRAALEQLRSQVGEELSSEVERVAGVPSKKVSTALPDQ